jgi:hypothetical protein
MNIIAFFIITTPFKADHYTWPNASTTLLLAAWTAGKTADNKDKRERKPNIRYIIQGSRLTVKGTGEDPPGGM